MAAFQSRPIGDFQSTLVCAKIGEHRVSFNSMRNPDSASVLVSVGEHSALISRVELAAAAALFPYKEQHP